MEKQNIEYKTVWKDEYLEWICGFANAQGGKIYIGCADDGTVVGVKNPKKLLEDIPNKIQATLGIAVPVNLLESNGLSYIEIQVPPYQIGISYKGVYYYRSGATRQILNGPALESFLMRKRGATWDNMALPAFTINDVDNDAVEFFKSKARKKGRMESEDLDEPNDVLLEKLLLKNGDYFTNAAMLMFSREPERWQVGAYTKIGFFENDANLLYQDEVHGSILEQVDKVVELVYLKYMKAKITYEGMQRVERYFVPELALREAVINALCHKQYESGVPIQISVYEDQLYVANVGRLPENWTIDNLMHKHPSRPYNPNIASVFYKAGFIESWGRGVEKMWEACEEAGVPAPEYTINPGDIMIHFKAPENLIVRTHSEVTERVNEKVNDRVNNKVNERQAELLQLLIEDPGYTVTDLSEKMHLSRKTIAGYINQLKKENMIVRVGSSRKGYWKVQQ